MQTASESKSLRYGCWVAYAVLALMLGLPVAGWLMQHDWHPLAWGSAGLLVCAFLLHRPLLVLALWLGLTR